MSLISPVLKLFFFVGVRMIIKRSMPRPPKEFKADRPFVCVIHDKKVVLFVSAIRKLAPSSGSHDEL